MKLFTASVAFILLSTVLSCTDEPVENGKETACLKAKYVMAYCPSDRPMHVIEFYEPTKFGTEIESISPDSTHYMAAVLELPESVQKKDAEFFIQFQFDEKDQALDGKYYCQTIHTKLKILSCDGISPESCQSSLTKL